MKALLKKPYTLPVIILVALLAYLLWPLQSEEHDLEWDQAMLAGKQAYLEKPAQPSDSVPNVLIIMVDDLSVADIDLYDEAAPVKTPEMNRLAQDGVLFNNAYVTSPVCSPSRAAIITGRYPQRFGYQFQMHDRYLKNRLEYLGFKFFINSDPWVPQWKESVPTAEAIGKQGLPPSEITIAELMQRQGYATGLVGKWHLGVNKENLPCALGFDEFWGFYESHSLYAPEDTPGIVDQKIDDDWTDPYIWSGQRNGPHAIHVNCEEQVEENGYLTFRIAEESIEFMSNHTDQPFFLWTSFNAPHTPLQAPQAYVDKYMHVEDPVKRVHYAMIDALDKSVGSILDYLDEAGLSDNTMVILIGDNGGAEYNLTTENGDYKGGKITQFEGGIKVPFIIRYPPSVPKGKEFNHPVISTDVFVTASLVAGADLPNDRTYDGQNLIPAVNKNEAAHDYLFWQAGLSRSIRSEEWKLSWNGETGDTLLFDIRRDPFERKNLFEQQRATASDLFATHQTWSDELPPPLWPALIYYEFTDDDGHPYFFSN
jgi:arylsulfatase A-like enzyme